MNPDEPTADRQHLEDCVSELERQAVFVLALYLHNPDGDGSLLLETEYETLRRAICLLLGVSEQSDEGREIQAELATRARALQLAT